jgi:hypothetical protein
MGFEKAFTVDFSLGALDGGLYAGTSFMLFPPPPPNQENLICDKTPCLSLLYTLFLSLCVILRHNALQTVCRNSF